MLADTANRAASQHEINQELMFTPTGKAFRDMMSSDAVKAFKLRDDAGFCRSSEGPGAERPDEPIAGRYPAGE
jgi:hypothetical protein